MTNILDRVAQGSARSRYNHFRPKTMAELFALRLAQKLGEPEASTHFASLLDRSSESQMLRAFRKTVFARDPKPARRFHAELTALADRSGNNGNAVHYTPLAAIRVDRRAVAIAILNGDHLEYTQTRQLVASPEKAAGSAVNFIGRIIDKFSV